VKDFAMEKELVWEKPSPGASGSADSLDVFRVISL
jgi:hypothetical protein